MELFVLSTDKENPILKRGWQRPSEDVAPVDRPWPAGHLDDVAAGLADPTPDHVVLHADGEKTEEIVLQEEVDCASTGNSRGMLCCRLVAVAPQDIHPLGRRTTTCASSAAARRERATSMKRTEWSLSLTLRHHAVALDRID